VKLTALINDTTGTLIASHYVNPRTKIGVIFGTGCNAAYMEKVGNIEKIKNLGLPPDQEMAINCEWVCEKLPKYPCVLIDPLFGSAGCI
jgi:hexokinase